MSIIYIILVKLHKYFCNVNSKQDLAKWLNVFINLLDNVKLSFRKLHHTMLSQHCMSTHFPIPHPQFGGNSWYLSTFSLNFDKLHGEKSYSIIVLACIFFYYQLVSTFRPVFWYFFFFYLLSNLYLFVLYVYFIGVFYWIFHLLFLF